MRKIKLIGKERTKKEALNIEDILKKNNIDVTNTTKSGVYIKIDDNLLKDYFNCKFDKTGTRIIDFKIPSELAKEVIAIYEPAKPVFFKDSEE
ncbi:hypothetical protein [Ulvibacterium sp.]|uniref:hypothetical protein n=1 Tax=Ulvibacterium sp. TaxID=2665914 RepID=UPI003BA916A2